MLMSVYAKEQPQSLAAALESIAIQTHVPEEIVLVKDGPLTPGLEATISRYEQRLNLKIHAIAKNVGLAAALNEGLKVATQPWIMRFDSDDICVGNRVELQAAVAATGNVDLFGGQILEFEERPDQASRQREVPCEPDHILNYASRRNPFNHMTVCFRRELAVSVGGYPEVPLMEDYALWTKLLANGARATNMSEVLVLARAGRGMVARRGGLRYVRSEWQMQRFMVDLGLKTKAAALVHGTVRSLVFMAPGWLRQAVYDRILRRRATTV